MIRRTLTRRTLPLAALWLLALQAAGCGSSSSSTTSVAAPSDVRCAVSVGTPAAIESGGGSGTLTIDVNRECTWTAKAEVSWITVSPASGQGQANLTYKVAANPQSTARKGGITVNERRVELTQAGSPCTFAISPGNSSVGAGEDRRTVAVTAPGGCSWTARSEAGWLTVTSGSSGSGNGSVRVAIAANTGAARTGTVRIAGRAYEVSQAAANAPAPPPAPPDPECTYSLSQTSRAFEAAGGNGSVQVRAGSGCAWTAAASASWLMVTDGRSGTGNGTVEFTVARNTGSAPRTATLTIGGAVFTVTQAGAATTCTYELSDSSASFDDGGGNGSVRVETQGGCTWTAASSVPWVTVTSGASGSGAGQVRYSVAANGTAASRTGTLTIAGRTLTITQSGSQPCAFDLSDSGDSFEAVGGTGEVEVEAPGGCAWTARSNVPWVTIAAGASGSGNGTVRFTVAENASTGSRSGTLTIAGETFTVAQEGVIRLTLRGTVSQLGGNCPFLTFVVSGRSVRTNAGTAFRRTSCDNVRNGMVVTVEGGVFSSDNIVVAGRVTREDDDD